MWCDRPNPSLQEIVYEATENAKIAVAKCTLHRRGFTLLSTTGHYGYRSTNRRGFTTDSGFVKLLLAAAGKRGGLLVWLIL